MNSLDFFKLKGKPFENVNNPDHYFKGYDHTEALNRLLYLVKEDHMSFGVLTGEIGCGKTFTRLVLKERLIQDGVEVLDWDNSNTPFNYFLYDLVLRLSGRPMRDEKLAENIYFLTQEYEQLLDTKIRHMGKKLVLILDEAQQLSHESLIELKNLTNIKSDQRSCLTIILVSQPELRESIKQLPQLDQRISLRFHLNPFSVEDTSKYIKWRIQCSGHPSGDLFNAEALDYVARHTSGIPREINRVCQLSLAHAFASKSSIIGLDIVKAIIEDIQKQRGG